MDGGCGERERSDMMQERGERGERNERQKEQRGERSSHLCCWGDPVSFSFSFSLAFSCAFRFFLSFLSESFPAAAAFCSGASSHRVAQRDSIAMHDKCMTRCIAYASLMHPMYTLCIRRTQPAYITPPGFEDGDSVRFIETVAPPKIGERQ